MQIASSLCNVASPMYPTQFRLAHFPVLCFWNPALENCRGVLTGHESRSLHKFPDLTRQVQSLFETLQPHPDSDSLLPLSSFLLMQSSLTSRMSSTPLIPQGHSRSSERSLWAKSLTPVHTQWHYLSVLYISRDCREISMTKALSITLLYGWGNGVICGIQSLAHFYMATQWWRRCLSLMPLVDHLLLRTS